MLELSLAVLVLIFLEIILGIDNIIFISIVTSRLPEEKQKIARFTGLLLAMFARIALLFAMSWLITLTKPLFSTSYMDISGRDLFLFLGGLFLVYKGVSELIHLSYEKQKSAPDSKKAPKFWWVMGEIVVLDIVFSLDSVISAIGFLQSYDITERQLILLASLAIIITVVILMFFANFIAEFIDKTPSMKILALLFLILVGFSLMSEGVDISIPKGYIYSALGFSLVFESINLYKKAQHEKN